MRKIILVICLFVAWGYVVEKAELSGDAAIAKRAAEQCIAARSTATTNCEESGVTGDVPETQVFCEPRVATGCEELIAAAEDAAYAADPDDVSQDVANRVAARVVKRAADARAVEAARAAEKCRADESITAADCEDLTVAAEDAAYAADPDGVPGEVARRVVKRAEDAAKLAAKQAEEAAKRAAEEAAKRKLLASCYSAKRAAELAKESTNYAVGALRDYKSIALPRELRTKSMSALDKDAEAKTAQAASVAASAQSVAQRAVAESANSAKPAVAARAAQAATEAANHASAAVSRIEYGTYADVSASIRKSDAAVARAINVVDECLK